MIRMKREDEGEERRLHKLITEMIICVNDASDGIIESTNNMFQLTLEDNIFISTYN